MEPLGSIQCVPHNMCLAHASSLGLNSLQTFSSYPWSPSHMPTILCGTEPTESTSAQTVSMTS